MSHQSAAGWAVCISLCVQQGSLDTVVAWSCHILSIRAAASHTDWCGLKFPHLKMLQRWKPLLQPTLTNSLYLSFFLFFLTHPPTLSESANLQAPALLYLRRCILCMTVLLRGNKKEVPPPSPPHVSPHWLWHPLGCECVPGVSLR